MRTAKDIFEEELSGEPLCQEAVEEAITIAQREAISVAYNIDEISYRAAYVSANGTEPEDFEKVSKALSVLQTILFRGLKIKKS